MILEKIQKIDTQNKRDLIASFIKENTHLEFIVLKLKVLQNF